MSSGSENIGDSQSDFQFVKTWSGADGLGQENAYTMSTSKSYRSKSSIVGSPSDPQYYANCGVVQPLSFDSNARLRMISDLVKSIKGHEFNLAVAAGEGRKTIDLVSASVSNFAKSVKSLKKGDGGGALRHLGLISTGNSRGKALDTSDIAKTWLSIQYGWKPLLNDVFESAKAFEKLSSSPRQYTYRAQSSVQSKGDSSVSPTNWSCPSDRFIGKRMKLTLVEELSAPRSLGLLDPLSVAWELTPFSFMADWFIPIGTYFEALNLSPVLSGRPIVESTLSIQNSSVGKVFNTAVYDPLGFKHDFSRASLTREIVPFQVPVPKFNDPSRIYNEGRLKNSLALARLIFF